MARVARTVTAAGAAALILLGGAGVAAATPAQDPVTGVSAQVVQEMVDREASDVALTPDQFNDLVARVAGKLPHDPEGARQLIEKALQDWGLIPGPSAPAVDPRTQPTPGNPCPAAAKACVDLGKQQSWLQNNGHIYHGPVPIRSGKPGYETPKGWHTVNRKVKHEVSRPYGNAPMPNAVYFTHNGIAFHQGSLDTMSAGCVRMTMADSERYFNDLQIGDKVYVF